MNRKSRYKHCFHIDCSTSNMLLFYRHINSHSQKKPKYNITYVQKHAYRTKKMFLNVVKCCFENYSIFYFQSEVHLSFTVSNPIILSLCSLTISQYFLQFMLLIFFVQMNPNVLSLPSKMKKKKRKILTSCAQVISCCRNVIILELVFKAKLRSYQQQCSQ